MQVTVRYFAGARAAAGVDQEKIELDAAADSVASQGIPTIADLAELLGRRHGEDLSRVLAACTFLLDEVAGSRERPLRDGAQIDVLPPFAGG